LGYLGRIGLGELRRLERRRLMDIRSNTVGLSGLPCRSIWSLGYSRLLLLDCRFRRRRRLNCN